MHGWKFVFFFPRPCWTSYVENQQIYETSVSLWVIYKKTFRAFAHIFLPTTNSDKIWSHFFRAFWSCQYFCSSFKSKKSPTGPSERTPKPEYLIALVTYWTGSVGKVPLNFWWIKSNQLMVNWWFGLVVWIPRIPSWKGLLLRGI